MHRQARRAWQLEPNVLVAELSDKSLKYELIIRGARAVAPTVNSDHRTDAALNMHFQYIKDKEGYAEPMAATLPALQERLGQRCFKTSD